MKIFRKGFGRSSATWFVVGCLIALTLSFLGPTHVALSFRSPDVAPHMCREMGRHTTLDLTDGGQDTQIDGAIYNPLRERPLASLVATAFSTPVTATVVVTPSLLPFRTRRKLLSPRKDDPDPLL